MFQFLFWVTVGLAASGCIDLDTREMRYLQSAQDRALQEEVRAQLGEPVRMISIPDGESVWVYEARELEPGSQDTWSTRGAWCDRYVLTFDSSGMLRRWTHASYLHGGELMPIQCDSGVLKALHEQGITRSP